jgi:hypothetical protein
MTNTPQHQEFRAVGLIEKIIGRLRSPLASVPECKHMTSFLETAKHGFMAPSYRAIAETLVFAVQYATHASVPGEIAEFGCQSGRTATAIASMMKLVRTTKTLHLFDSFEGLPPSTHHADQDNLHVKSGVWGAGELKGISPAQIRSKCERYLAAESIFVYKGWFSESLPKVPKGTKFSMLHIDCDLYSSALDVLDFTFGHHMVSEGAILLFDDWDCNHASNEHGERKAWREMVKKYNIVAEDYGSYGWTGHKFIIQSYSVNP